MYNYRICLMFRSGFSFVYFASRWPFTKLKTTKIRISTSGNEAHTPVREYFVKQTFACFREIKYLRNIRCIWYIWVLKIMIRKYV